MLDRHLQSKLVDLSRLLIDQHRAKVIVPPHLPNSGYWFGGGNLTVGPDGDFYLVGRYRNEGDSRTGLVAGRRGLELAVFRSRDQGGSFEKVFCLSKQDLSLPHAPVLSIEGVAIRFRDQMVDLFVSTEKDGVGYPAPLASYMKPGTGVWSIDRIRSDSVEGLMQAPVAPLFASADPATIHVKDPFLYECDNTLLLFFCSHPFSWTCSNTGYLKINNDTSEGASSHRVSCSGANFDFFPRGNVWDVAMSRGTCVIDIPRVGAFSDHNVQLMFYDGGECVRDLDQHANSVSRPRGYSCEELGGVAYFLDRQWSRSERLSKHEPMFVSPFGTGCSRYVDVLNRPEGMYATWQQAQEDGSQPLVCHFLPRSEIESALS